MEDRRKFPRVLFDLPVTITLEKEKDSCTCPVANLSVEGISFQFQQSLPLETGLYINFPDTGGVRESDIPATVVRCEELPDPESLPYRVIAGFIEINDIMIMDLLSLVQSGGAGPGASGGPSLFDRAGGRATLDRVHRALLSKASAHPWLGRFFRGADVEALAGKLSEFMTYNMGGGNTYAGLPPLKGHQHLFITEKINDIRHGLLRDCLVEAGLDKEIIGHWLRIDKAFERSVIKSDPSQCMKRTATDEIVIVPEPE